MVLLTLVFDVSFVINAAAGGFRELLGRGFVGHFTLSFPDTGPLKVIHPSTMFFPKRF